MRHVELSHLGNCSRCGGEHRGLIFKPFTRPPEDEDPPITHFAMCPENGEPILIGMREVMQG